MEFFDLKSVEEARELFLAVCRSARPASERVSLAEARGRTTAVRIICTSDLPAFPRTTVDGYAVRAADTFGASEGLPAYLKVTGEVVMGKKPPKSIYLGETLKISTGGALPKGSDAVVMIEHTEPLAEDEIGVTKPVSPGENVMYRGEDCRAGDELLPAHHLIRAQELALLSSAGVLEVEVVRRPRVAVISTGDELVDPADEPGPGQIRESNGVALQALLYRDGCEPTYLGRAMDREEEIRAKLQAGMAYDVIMISGGSSVGVRDLTATMIAELGEPGILVHGVKLKPGKPTILAVAGGVPVVGLPGHPVSAQVVYGLFMEPLLRQMQGLAPEREFQPTIRAKMTKNIPSATGRYDCVRVRLRREGDEVHAEPVYGKSGLISTLVKADGLVAIPSAKEGILAGEWVEVELLV